MPLSTLTTRKARQFSLRVLGRTLEHLGVQTYKRRDTAIAELVANCWDAGAENVSITVPDESSYDFRTSRITIRDDGCGMAEDEVQNAYLVIGRDRRKSGSAAIESRKVMGRKGIGKLAGFGIASRMVVRTWRNGALTEFTLNVDDLNKPDNEVGNVAIDASVGRPPADLGEHGTELELNTLKHLTPLDIAGLRDALARRFSRTARGEMTILVNDLRIQEPPLEMTDRFPGEADTYLKDEIQLADGRNGQVRYYYGFAKKPIRSRELRGFTIYVHEKTAQAPPFFFDVEATATGQHGTKYVTGAIEVDFLDDGPTDLISTDRQEIDWEADEVQPFKKWGDELSRRVLRDWRDRKEQRAEAWILEATDIRRRIEALDSPSQKQVKRFLRTLGRVEGDSEESVRSLADSLVQAYEFRHFHDVVQEIEATDDDPESLRILLKHLREWQVLESRAILEVVRGRLEIVDKFRTMIADDAPETAPRVGDDNIHDLLAGYPWLLNPEWQILAEEKAISTQLREWTFTEIEDEDSRLRYDYLALSDDCRLVVVDIKRPGIAVGLDELQRLERYKERLARAEGRNLHMLLVCGVELNVTPGTRETWKERKDGEILLWSRLCDRAKAHYEQYRAILERHITDPSFARKTEEVRQTRHVLESGTSYRGREARARGLGPQDITLEDDTKA